MYCQRFYKDSFGPDKSHSAEKKVGVMELLKINFVKMTEKQCILNHDISKEVLEISFLSEEHQTK